MMLIGLLGALALLVLWAVVRGYSRPVRHISEASSRTVAVDLDAFRNLVSTSERQYLQTCLPVHAFRRVQRARSVAIAEYLWRIAHNASVLMRVGEAARASHDPDIARAGAALTSVAIATRIYASLALLQVAIGYLFPSCSWSLGKVIKHCERMDTSLGMVRILWRSPVPQV